MAGLVTHFSYLHLGFETFYMGIGECFSWIGICPLCPTL